MRYDYWVVRYVPDVVRGEFVNIGVIAGHDDEWSYRRVSNLRRAARLGGSPSYSDAFSQKIERVIEARLEAVDAFFPDGSTPAFGRGDIEDLRVRMNNLVQLSDPRPVLARSADEAVKLAFELMVVESEADVNHRTRTRVVHRLRDAFALRPELGRHVSRSQLAAVGAQETSIDFAVEDGIVRQMSQVWAFDVKDTRNLQTQIQAWNYLLALLREDGGRLTPRNHNSNGVQIPSGVEINAVYADPVTAAGEAQFAIAREGWRRLGVDVVPSSESESIIDEAERLLRSSAPSE
ncbi:DUF3037 domain-containing protein [Kribbella sp. CA-293567]|uniref:DUF3037 domain-containing protein n=1 Tax=Kribbella sp. CA-293567 TaxID=3002436 RepID=UPI0022DCF583|nr:DUF3037 domain-containing protein [Kribbella sp. CA-293567]WBQ05303.1 DUF3037 domain-containing protein [Kribbella sp. CA-293567]